MSRAHVCGWPIERPSVVSNLVPKGSYEVLDEWSLRICIAPNKEVAEEIAKRWNLMESI